jgi:putative transposase
LTPQYVGLRLKPIHNSQFFLATHRKSNVLSLDTVSPITPSGVKCLGNSVEACLTFFICPEEEWISLRTTNIIERLNKEFKRRTKPMEIVAGENACYTLLAFICLKMELHWKSNPIGKVRKDLPFFQKLADKNFTQKT